VKRCGWRWLVLLQIQISQTPSSFLQSHHQKIFLFVFFCCCFSCRLDGSLPSYSPPHIFFCWPLVFFAVLFVERGPLLWYFLWLKFRFSWRFRLSIRFFRCDFWSQNFHWLRVKRNIPLGMVNRVTRSDAKETTTHEKHFENTNHKKKRKMWGKGLHDAV